MRPTANFLRTVTLALFMTGAAAAPALPGSATAATIRVDPAHGNDSWPGTVHRPLASLTEAWNRLPAVTHERTVIELAGGDYRGRSPIWWEGHSGRRGAPILIRAAGGRNRPRLPAVNLYGVRRVEFRRVNFRDGGDVIHCERCRNFTLRRVTAEGRGAQETVKVNQSSRVRILGSRIGGAGDNAIDFVAVNDGVIRNSVIHSAGDWCGYAKGGSVNIRVSGNLFTDCGTGGFTAGQGTGFQFMVRPWLQYEANGVVIRNNTVTETEGAAFGVQGGFNVLVKNNVARRTGRRSHVLEALYGSRSCDGRPGDDGRGRCGQYLAAGGWGTTVVDDGTNYVRIGNHHVYFVGNVISNPAPYRSLWQHLEVPAPWGAQPGSNVPPGSSAGSDLRFLRNVIWNGPRSMPVGASGCLPGNVTCNPRQLKRQNLFSSRRPSLRRRGRLFVATGWTRRYRRFRTPPPQWSDLPAGTAPWRTWPR